MVTATMGGQAHICTQTVQLAQTVMIVAHVLAARCASTANTSSVAGVAYLPATATATTAGMALSTKAAPLEVIAMIVARECSHAEMKMLSTQALPRLPRLHSVRATELQSAYLVAATVAIARKTADAAIARAVTFARRRHHHHQHLRRHHFLNHHGAFLARCLTAAPIYGCSRRHCGATPSNLPHVSNTIPTPTMNMVQNAA